LDRLLGLVRRWAVDWLAAANPSVFPAILTPAYSILIGGHTPAGPDPYTEGTLAQLTRLPGPGVTNPAAICVGQHVVARFLAFARRGLFQVRGPFLEGGALGFARGGVLLRLESDLLQSLPGAVGLRGLPRQGLRVGMRVEQVALVLAQQPLAPLDDCTERPLAFRCVP